MGDIDIGSLLFWVFMLWAAFKLGEITAVSRLGKALLDGLEENGVKVSRNADGTLDFDMEETYIEIEKVNTQYFAYTVAGEFLGQGTNFKGLFQVLKERHPDKNFRLDKNQKSLTATEVDEMIKCIFEVYNDKELKNGEAGK
jgi:hypothetical protein